MPMYGYICSRCDRRVEEHRKIEYRDVPPMTCPSCGADKTFTRETAAPAFVLQGSGWHNMEYNKTRRRKD